MRRILISAAAGLIATVAMSGAMVGIKRRLPWYQRYPLPPRLITSRVLQKLGVSYGVRRRHARALTVANHLGFGTTAGALYAPLTFVDVSPLVSGSVFGIAVWAASYLGWLPDASILPSARITPRERTALMVASHLVWGVSLAAIARSTLTRREPPAT